MPIVALSLEGVALQVGEAFGALEERLSPEGARAFLAELGVQFPAEVDQNAAIQSALASASSAAGQVAARAADLRAAADGGSADAVVIATAADVVRLLGEAIPALNGVRAAFLSNSSGLGLPSALVETFAAELTTRILHHSVMLFAEGKVFRLVNVLGLFGIVRRLELPTIGDVDLPPPLFTRRALRLGDLAAFLASPVEVLRDLYGFGGADFGDLDAPDARSGLDLLVALTSFLRPLGYSPTFEFDANGLPTLESFLFALAISRRLATPGIEIRTKVELPEVTGFEDELLPGWQARSSVTGAWPVGTRLSLEGAGDVRAALPDGAPVSGALLFDIRGIDPDGGRLRLLGQTGSSVLEAGSISIGASLAMSPHASGVGLGTPLLRLALNDGRAVIGLSEGDGFLKALTAETRVEAGFELAATVDLVNGLRFEIGGLAVQLPLHASFGGVGIEGLRIAIPIDLADANLPIEFTTTLRATLGPFSMVVEEVGLALALGFDGPELNLGVVNVVPSFRFPNGIGAAIDGGAVSGGGFLSREELTGRYAGALELRVFSIGVKAFGLLDTKFPDGSEGVSFVVLIIAEFTPIQLGFGFTLLGVGGLLGLNRSFNAQAMGDAVRTGALDHLLFPRNPVQDAPAIIHDLLTVFPASRGHHIFGPLGKFGWGTPTLISADLGVVLEFPGPRLALLGVARMQLPSPEAALLRLQMALAGVLDFPAKTLAVDAGLFESSVVGFPVSGDMAFRLGFGNKAKFLLSVGGFNPSFDAPPGVPELRRASVDLGVNGNPSLTASGYFALTSNTAQIGAKVELRASGAGVRLHGHLGFDALFVFAPFSFVASFSAGMRVSFHGAGLGVTLRGSLSGPSPWHIKGKVCVSVLWWDACLSVDHKFGRREPAALPEMDPWVGTPEGTDARIAVIGLAEAIADARNWSGSNPPAGFGVVSLAASSTATTTPIDPLGAATLRQKVVPLETEIEKFGEYRPVGHTGFERSLVTINGEAVADNEIEAVEDDFAPAHFFDFDDADKLSMESYVPMEAGFSINANRVDIGSDGSQVMAYKTEFITAEGEKFEDPTTYIPTQAQLRQMLKRCASALGGIRRAGPRKYIVPNRPKKVTLGPKRYVVVDACTSLRNTAITGTGVTQIQALLKLRKHVAANPADRTRFAVAPVHAEL